MREKTKMRITEEWLLQQNACDEGIEWFKQQKKRDGIRLVEALIPEHPDWANWLIVRLLSGEGRVRYGIYAAEQALPIFEAAYLKERGPRLAIKAAKAVLKNDTAKNREAANVAAGAAERAAGRARWATGAAAWAAWAAEGVAWAAGRMAWAARVATWAAWAAGRAAGPAIYQRIVRYGIELARQEGH